jgi:broad specificity polyphosphatase/5'/3'-nucleotidase SurE
MPKLAICKITMIGSPVLILGVGRQFVDGGEHWTLRQLWTREDFLNVKFKYNPPDPTDKYYYCRWKSQEEADIEAEQMREDARSHSKLHGDSLYFEKLNKTVPITKSSHDFDLSKAQFVEITVDELDLLQEDMIKEDWMAFDEETWGK